MLDFSATRTRDDYIKRVDLLDMAASEQRKTGQMVGRESSSAGSGAVPAKSTSQTGRMGRKSRNRMNRRATKRTAEDAADYGAMFDDEKVEMNGHPMRETKTDSKKVSKKVSKKDPKKDQKDDWQVDQTPNGWLHGVTAFYKYLGTLYSQRSA